MATVQPCGQSSDPTEHLQCRIAADRREREAAFRLLHDSYAHSGLIQPNPYGMRVTPYHLLHTTEVFVAALRDEVICTFSLVGDGELGVPMEAIYPELIAERRAAGIRIRRGLGAGGSPRRCATVLSRVSEADSGHASRMPCSRACSRC